MLVVVARLPSSIVYNDELVIIYYDDLLTWKSNAFPITMLR